MNFDDATARRLLRSLFDAAIAAANPALVLPPHLPKKPRGRCVVVGAGKAAAAMAAAVEIAWPDVNLSGVVATRHGHHHHIANTAGRIAVIEAGHPIPDAGSERAARQILAAITGLTANDLVLVLLSGGGSALLSLPAVGITAGDKQAIGRALLASGASIAEINTVRRRMSAIKGGRLATAASPARVVTLAISDVPGDAPADIASGPTVTDPSTPIEALAVLARYHIDTSHRLRAAIYANSPVVVAPASYRLIATPAIALNAAAAKAARMGVKPLILGDAIEGESREAGRVMAGIAASVRHHSQPLAPPAILLSGGETTVSIGLPPPGRGGRNTEFLLSAAIQLNGLSQIYALAADTDGIDGTDDAAGAIITPTTLARAQDAGLDPRRHLVGHDSYSLFAAIGDLLITGPTLTNVNDFRAILVTG